MRSAPTRPSPWSARDDVALPGEVEGLTFTDDGQMLVLNNRCARIVLGMPVGFYDGYDREVHEVYAYHMMLYDTVNSNGLMRTGGQP